MDIFRIAQDSSTVRPSVWLFLHTLLRGNFHCFGRKMKKKKIFFFLLFFWFFVEFLRVFGFRPSKVTVPVPPSGLIAESGRGGDNRFTVDEGRRIRVVFRLVCVCDWQIATGHWRRARTSWWSSLQPSPSVALCERDANDLKPWSWRQNRKFNFAQISK